MKLLLRSGGETIRFSHALIFVRTILQTTKVHSAPVGGVGKLLSPAHPNRGVQHLQINRPQRPF